MKLILFKSTSLTLFRFGGGGTGQACTQRSSKERGRTLILFSRHSSCVQALMTFARMGSPLSCSVDIGVDIRQALFVESDANRERSSALKAIDACQIFKVLMGKYARLLLDAFSNNGQQHLRTKR